MKINKLAVVWTMIRMIVASVPGLPESLSPVKRVTAIASNPIFSRKYT